MCLPYNYCCIHNCYYYGLWCLQCYPYQIQQFNYECPDCHGKFNYPAYKYFQVITIIDNGGSASGYYANACPFCGREMKGMNQ